MGKSRPFDTAHRHIMRQQRGVGCLHHREGHDLIIGAMHQKNRRMPCLGGNPLIGQKGAGKADHRGRTGGHPKPTMQAHHASLRKSGQRDSRHLKAKLINGSCHGLFNQLAGGDRPGGAVGKIKPLPPHRVHRTGLWRVRDEEGSPREAKGHRIGQIGKIIRIRAPAMHDQDQAGSLTAARRGGEHATQRTKTLHHQRFPFCLQIAATAFITDATPSRQGRSIWRMTPRQQGAAFLQGAAFHRT